MIKNTNSKITSHNYQQLNLKQKQTKQTTRTGTESLNWRSQGVISGEKMGERYRELEPLLVGIE